MDKKSAARIAPKGRNINNPGCNPGSTEKINYSPKRVEYQIYMLYLRQILASIAIILLSHQANAQILREHFFSNIEETSDSSTLFLAINASTFFNNNEYFDAPVEGYTLTGAYFQPFLFYQINPLLRMGAGVHLLKYNGREEMEQALPLFRIDYFPNKNLSISMGSFNGGEYLMLPEPVYQFENQFNRLVNNGILINYTNHYISSRTWLGWERFIKPGDTFQEELSFGSSNQINLLENNEYSFRIPAQILIHHRGGQINNNNQPVTTAMELSFGLDIQSNQLFSFFDSANFTPMFFINRGDADDSHGSAIYPQIFLHKSIIDFSLGYFRGHLFQTTFGDPIYFGFHRFSEFYHENRDIISFKIGFGKKITSGSSLILKFDGYYDLNNSAFQYNYGLHIVLNEMFRLKDFRK
jgi:hypothetical protein